MEPIEGILLDKEGNPVPRPESGSRIRVLSFGPLAGPLVGGAIVAIAILAGLTLLSVALALFAGFFLLRALIGLVMGGRPSRNFRTNVRVR